MKHKYTMFCGRIFSAALLFSLIFNTYAYSQLVVTAGGTPQSIINAFVGSGLNVSNINLNCGADTTNAAYGTFNGSSSNIGLPNGVILSTGNAALAVGPNTSNSAGIDRLVSTSDPQITAIEPLATHDLCVLEFDIVPHCSSLQMRFVFGSEEYPEFVNSGYNDVFGFFVTGPDSNCVPLFYNNTNVAVLPNGSPVSIDNINNGNTNCPGPMPGPCVNCAYYVDNCGGATVEYDGFTTAIIVNLSVCPCATYHWKFAIADAGDGIYDSGILIEYLSCAAPFSYNVDTQDASCSCDGSATVNVTSGSPPYTYLWSNNDTTQTVTGLCPGTYTVSVTDAASCNIPVVQTFTINSSSTAVNVTTTQNNVSCNLGNDGSATASVTVGSPPYSYSWNTVPVQTTATAMNLNAGNYTVTVTDSLGCIGTAQVTITEPTAIAIAFDNYQHTTCGDPNGSISPTYSGGTGPYTYSWNTTPVQTTASVSNLAAGAYTVVVTDANNCTASASFTINSSAPPVVSTTAPTSICVGGSTVIGASGASTYVWSPASSLSASTGSSVTANPSVTTMYQVIGTDAVGCTDTAYVTITVNPLPLVVSPANPSYCIGGSVQVCISGASYYQWSPLTGISNASPDSSCVDINAASTTTYTVTGYSAEGCSATTSFTVTVNPNPVAVITPNGPTSFCDGGSVVLTASGGSSFLWSDNSSSASITVSTQGTYTVTVTDNNTCSGSTSETVTVFPLPVAVISPAGPVLICSTTPATLSANTGPGYVYQWYENNSMLSGEVNPTLTVTIAGSYTVHITDGNGCTATSSAVQVSEGLGPDVTISVSPTIGCLQNTIYIGYGPQSITLTANAMGAASYLWFPDSQTTQSISVTQPGAYSVIAYDINGCPSPNPAVLTPAINVIDIRCGQGKKKIILCHVPEGNPGNPQTICVGPPSIPHHLALHQYDCLGPCSLYYPRLESPTFDDETKVMLYPNPFSSTFIISVENINGEPILLNMYDVTGRIILANYMIKETVELGADLIKGVYSVEVLIGERREMYRIVKL